MRAGVALLFFPALLLAGPGQTLLQSLQEGSLDSAECYRIRDVNFARDEAQVFLTDGYLIFGKPVGGGERITAFFSAEVEGGDAELLLLPPDRSERRTLAAHAGSPNLEEHFLAAGMVFGSDTYRELLEAIKANPYNQKSPEMGALLAQRWSPFLRNLGANFSLRSTADLLSPQAGRKGFFAAALQGRKLGRFDLVFDPRAPEQLLLGSPTDAGFQIWTSFPSRSFRKREFAPEFQLSDYRIRSVLDSDLVLHCQTKIKANLRNHPEGALPFEITQPMRIKSASVDGHPAEVLTGNADPTGAGTGGFVIVPAEPLAPGIHEVEIAHEGKVIAEAGNRVFSVGSRGSWYPSRGLQYSTFDLTFTYPHDLDLVASGDPVEDRTDGKQRTTRYLTRSLIRLAGFNLGSYERVTVKRGSFTIEVCANRKAEQALQPRPQVVAPLEVPALRRSRPSALAQSNDASLITPPPPSPTARLKTLAAEIGEALDFYAARFRPLPLNRLEVSPVPGRFGQGFPGMIYLSTLSYLRPEDMAVSSLKEEQQLFYTDLLAAHETAHQWWGSVVTSPGYHDDWLMEALANYSALLLLEKKKGTRAVDLLLEHYRMALLRKSSEGDPMDSMGALTEGTRLAEAYIPVTYGKGTWVLHMLRRRMGEEAFLRMMSALCVEYLDKSLSTEQFRLMCAKFLPHGSEDPKLEAFFDQWVYNTGIPDLKLKYTVKGQAPALRVVGSVTQTGLGNDNTTDVPITIQFTKGRSITQWVAVSSEPAPFEIKVSAPPSKVAIEPYGVLHQ